MVSSMPASGCLIELHYLPSIAWFAATHRYEVIYLERHESFLKQTYRNRCYILGANRAEKLILPVHTKSNSRVITDIRLDYSQKWLNNHWRSIESAYRHAPYFEYFAEDFRYVFFRKYEFLYDLNYQLLQVCLKLLNLHVSVKETTAYEKMPFTGIADLRNQVRPKHAVSAKLFKPVTYKQVFGTAFVPNLSNIDLLFCKGPESRYIIEATSMHP